MKDRPPPTTVHLTEIAQKIKDKLAPIYGLKNILSASLILFSKLSDSDQKKAIYEALAEDIVDSAKADAKESKQNRGRKSPKAG